MATFLGFLELIAWGLAVLLLAAAMTFAMIKLFPSRDEKRPAGDAAS